MERVANRSVRQLWVVYQGADHHGPRVQSQADRDVVRLPPERVRRVQTLTQLEGRQHRPAGMVLLRHRRPKQGQEALAGDLEEGAAKRCTVSWTSASTARIRWYMASGPRRAARVGPRPEPRTAR